MQFICLCHQPHHPSCGIHKSGKWDFYSIIQTLIKILTDMDHKQAVYKFLYNLPSTLATRVLSCTVDLHYPTELQMSPHLPILPRKAEGESLLDTTLKLKYSTCKNFSLSVKSSK